MNQILEEILRTFRERQPLYAGFADSMQHLLGVVVKSVGVVPQIVTQRVKKENSFTDKFGREDKHYTALEDVTDVVGLRIITYFPDEVVDRGFKGSHFRGPR
jgi:ppGpp synthetase/RelA/SpoT-type nucleotidyltranferase